MNSQLMPDHLIEMEKDLLKNIRFQVKKRNN